MPGIVTSRTRSLYERPPEPPFDLNWAHHSTRGIVACWPLGEASLLGQNWANPSLYRLTANGTPVLNPGPDTGYSILYNGSSQNSELASTAVLTAAPITLEAYIWPTNNTAQQAVIALTDGDTGAQWFTLECDGNIAGDPIGASRHSSVSNEFFAYTTTTYKLNAWQHACATFATTTLMNSYLNGLGAGTDTNACTPGSLTRTGIGSFHVSATHFSPFAGRIADAIVRNVALSPTEVLERADPGRRFAIYAPMGRKTFSFKAAAAAAAQPWTWVPALGPVLAQ